MNHKFKTKVHSPSEITKTVFKLLSVSTYRLRRVAKEGRSGDRPPPSLTLMLKKKSKVKMHKMYCLNWTNEKRTFRFLFFWEMVGFVANFLKNLVRFLLTWFRNANQCYTVASWLWGFKPKASGAWGRSPWWGVWGAKPPMNRGFRVVELTNTKKMWNFFLPNLFFLLRNLKKLDFFIFLEFLKLILI